MTTSLPAPDDVAVPPPAGGGSALAERQKLGLKHYAWVIGAALVAGALLHWLAPILTPFLIGAILAYVGSPAVVWLQGRRVPRTLGTLLVIAMILLLLLALLLLLIPLIQTESALVIRQLPELVAALVDRIAPWLKEHFDITLRTDFASIKQLIADNLESAQSLSLKLLSGVKAGGTLLLALLINLALIPVVMFYLLRDWNLLVERIDDLLPRRWLATVQTMAGEIDDVLAEFLRGQLSVMAVLVVYYAIGLSVVGLQFALSIGILTGLLVFIPYVGFGLGLILGILAALLQWHGWPGFAAVLVVYGVGQLLENYLLVPWLVGDRIGLHPLAVIFALLAFGQLFGFAGVLLALPVSAVLLVALRHVRAAYVDSPLYR